MARLIHAEDAKKKLKEKDTVFIDVRTPAEFGSEHIPNSYNIPLDEIDSYKTKLHDLNKDMVIICRSGRRATSACEKLEHIENNQIRILDGGITSWIQHDYKVIKGKQRWDIERQVRFTAGLLVFIGVLFGYFISSYLYLLSGLVGLGLVFAAITNTCAMGYIFSKLPYNRGDDYKKELKKLLG